jgi:hypothetical protein
MKLKHDIVAKLQHQWRKIAASRLNASKRIETERYCKATGLTEADPPELMCVALSKSDPRPFTTMKQPKRAKELGDYVRQYDLDFDANAGEPYKNWHKSLGQLGRLTLRPTVQSLAAKARDDAQLSGWLKKLLKLWKRPQITADKYERASKLDDKTAALLLEHWIQDPPRNNWAKASLCFYSDRAMAKLLYFVTQPEGRREPLRLDKEAPETERIKKIYQRMGLVPAKHRLIKEVQFKDGKAYPIFCAAHLAQ